MLDDDDTNITMTMSSSISASSSSTSTTSILRQGPSNDINFISSMSASSSSSLSSCNSSSRRRRRSSNSSSSFVHFPPDDTIVTSIHTRPRTDKEDIPKLYYSSLQIRYFKQKYKDQHLFASCDCDRSTNRCIDGEHSSSDTDDSTAASSSSSEESNNLSCVISSLQRQQQLDDDASKNDDTNKTMMKTRQSRSTPRPDSSFWRTKVNWRWQSSSSTRKNTADIANRASRSSSDRYCCCNRTSSYSRRDSVVVGVGSSHSYLLN